MKDTMKLDVKELEEILWWLLSLDKTERESVIAEAREEIKIGFRSDSV
jgi:hypothetical protein